LLLLFFLHYLLRRNKLYGDDDSISELQCKNGIPIPVPIGFDNGGRLRRNFGIEKMWLLD